MRHVRILLLVVFAFVAIGVTVASVAGAEEVLSAILWLTSGESTIKGTIGNDTAVVAQFNSSFAKITAKRVSVSLSGAAGGMADLGTVQIDLEGLESSGHKCFTEGDSLEAGVFLVKGEWHVVLDLLGRYMILILIPEITYMCDGSIKFKIKGSELTLPLSGGMPVVTGTEYSAFDLDWECETAGSRKAKFKEYDNHAGSMATAKLEANGGLGFEEVCEEIKGEFALSAEPSIEFMEP